VEGLPLYQASIETPQQQFAGLVLDGRLFELAEDHFCIGIFNDYLRIIYSSSNDLVFSQSLDDESDVRAISTSLVNVVRCIKSLTEINLLSTFGLLNQTEFNRIRSELASTSKGNMILFDLLLSGYNYNKEAFVNDSK